MEVELGRLGGKESIVCKRSAGAVVNVFEVERDVVGLERVLCEETGDKEFAIFGMESVEERGVTVFFQQVASVNKGGAVTKKLPIVL